MPQVLKHGLIFWLLIIAIPICLAYQDQDGRSNSDMPSAELIEARKAFQSQEMITSQSGNWLFRVGETPRIIWRDVDRLRELGADVRFQVRWFDSDLKESPHPDHGGRWIAWIEGTAPNGTVFRRALTFFAIPENPEIDSAPDLRIEFPGYPGPNSAPRWEEHKAEFFRMGNDLLVRGLLESERGAIFVSGVMESKTLGRPARFTETAAVRNHDAHLRLKLRLLNKESTFQPLAPPRILDRPVPGVRQGTAKEAGVPADAAAKIEEFCEKWAMETGEPFVTLVARNGVIITHKAYGNDASGKPIDLNYRCWVASITKTVTAVMFSRFVDQKRVHFDEPISRVFPDFPAELNSRVPTFRQCMNHTSGLSGHGDFGGVGNPQLENIILNGVDINRPNSKYEYCGLGFELTAKAMEYMSGLSYARIYESHLFKPLGFGDVVLGNASSDGEFTALELGKLAMWFANEGSFENLELISRETFAEMMPRPTKVADGGYTEDEGLGIHWIRHRRLTPPANNREGGTPTEAAGREFLFGPRTFGHGSFSSCVFVIDPDQKLVITQVRRQSGPKHAEYSPLFFQTVSDAIAIP
ncbi:MAG: beta-lactamase family protein [Planctomyces sp.]|nr:beta-lactamase family protein [Planctomyces sp.]